MWPCMLLYFFCFHIKQNCFFHHHLSINYSIYSSSSKKQMGVANMLNSDVIVSEFKLQSCYYTYFQTNILGKGINSLITPAMVSIISLLFLSKDGLALNNTHWWLGQGSICNSNNIIKPHLILNQTTQLKS